MSIRSIFHPRIGIGINAGNSRYSCVKISKQVGRYVVEDLSDKHWNDKKAHGLDAQSFCHHLGVLLQKIRNDNKGKYYELNVALPDPVVLYHLVYLQQLPKSPQAVSELVKWNVAKHFHVDASYYAETHSYFGKQENKHEFLGGIIEKGLLSRILETIYNTGVLVTHVDTNIRYVFNYVYDKLENKPGALICLHSDYWSLCIWDAKKNIRYIQSRWRNQSDNKGVDIPDIAAISRRILFSYISTLFTNKIENLYIFAGDHEAKRLEGEVGLETNTLTNSDTRKFVYADGDEKEFSFIYDAMAIPQ